MRKYAKPIIGFLLSPLPRPEHPSVKGQPGLFIGWRLGFIKGWLMRPYWYLNEVLGGTRVRIGKRFSLQGQLKFKGPGTVIFGDDCTVFDRTTPFTHNAQAVIRFGNCVGLNGTRLGCEKEITVGDECVFGDCRIMDTDFHPTHRRRNEPGMEVSTKPVRIHRNVWIAAGAAVLKGVTIEEDSVVAFGAVVVRDVSKQTIVGGNPAREIAKVPDGPEPKIKAI